jgi:TolA-binding protein
MRFAVGVLLVLTALISAGGQSQDSSQLYYAVQSLQAEVRALQGRVQQMEVRQYDPRPREDSRDFDGLRQQVSRLEERIGQLEGRAPAPKAPPAKPEQPKK